MKKSLNSGSESRNLLFKNWTPFGKYWWSNPEQQVFRGLARVGYSFLLRGYTLCLRYSGNLPLETPSPGQVFIFYRHIAHVTPKKLRKVVFLRGKESQARKTDYIWLWLKKRNLSKWKHGPTSAVCPSCLISSHTHVGNTVPCTPL